MKTLLYFEEAPSILSEMVFLHSDITVVILRTTKNMKYFDEEYLERTKNYPTFIADFEKDISSEVERFKSWAKENYIHVTHFLNDSEYYLEYVNEFASLLGLDALSKQQTEWVRDKVSMKDKFNEMGLKTVGYQSVENKDDVKKYFIQNGCQPIVFKPRRGMNSIDTYKITSLKDIDDLNVNFKPGKYMVETFCFDHEWSIESIVQDGVVLDSYLTYIPQPTIWASISGGLNCHMTVPKVPEYFKFQPKKLIQTIVSGMELKNGVMTIEVFISDKGDVMPSELGWRLPGCQATMNHSLSYGFNFYNVLIDIALKDKVYLTYNGRMSSVGDLYLPNKEGIIDEITTVEELFQMEGVLRAKMFVKKGDHQVKRRVGNDASGWVQVSGDDEMQTLSKMQKIYDNFVIKTVEEKGVVYAKKK